VIVPPATVSKLSAITLSLKVAAPASDMSSVRAVISEVESCPLKIMSLSSTSEVITKSLELLLNLAIVVPSSLNITSPPSASKLISPPTSNVKSPASEIVDPFIVISSTVSVVSVPRLVMLVCAASVTFKPAKASTTAAPLPAPSK